MIKLTVIRRLLLILSLVLPMAAGAASSDHNDDGKSDILWRNAITGQNWIYLMDGATIMTSAEVNIVGNLDWKIASTADFNGDGNVDILWRNYATGENWMYLMNGSAITSSVRVNGVSNLNWRIVDSGDFDGDGKADILWREKSTGQNWMYLMDGATISTSANVNIVSNLNWHIVGIGDFDGDGKADIFWRDFVTGENWLYLMNGANITSSSRVNGVSNLNWRVVGNGDYNGDGKADILWRDQSSGQNWMYLMNGPSIATSAPVNVVSNQDWQIVGNGDYDGDNQSDILWREMTTGVNWLYLMNGPNISVSTRVNGVSNLSWEIISDIPPALTDSGLFVRPSNTTCVAPDRPTNNASVATEVAFPNLPALVKPLALLQAPGDSSQWYVVEQDGRVLRFDNAPNVSSVSTFIDIRGPGGSVDVNSSTGESGLLGMAFHPNYGSNRQVFLSYTVTGPGGSFPFTSRIARFTSNDAGLTLDATSEDVLLTLDQPFSNHNGGNIIFGPDGFLYIGFGDGGSSGDPGDRAQNTLNLFGSILRIDVDGGTPYGIPTDNPFNANPLCNNGNGPSACPEIYAWGLRNPWRWSFDSATGQLWLADVGQNQYEEVDVVELGGNYGWRCREGAHNYNSTGQCPAGLIDPLIEYGRSVGASITGGYVYRGTSIPELYGRYVFADYVTGKIFASTTDTFGNFDYEMLVDTNYFISTFGQDETGEHLFADYAGGTIYRIAQMGGTSTNTIPNQLSATGCVSSGDSSQPASGAIPYDVNVRSWSDGAEKQRWYVIPDGTTVDVDVDGDWLFPIGTILMKHFQLDGELFETRLFMRHTNGEWGGYTYEWNDFGTDATRVIGGKIKDVNGQAWNFPSESQCMNCHTSTAGFSLGLENVQLNKDFLYPSTAITANQLTTADTIDILTDPLSDAPANLRTLIEPADTQGSLEDRARSYLHSNCAHCHQPLGPTPSNMDLRFQIEFSATNTCEVTPTSGDMGIFNSKIIALGDSARSVLVNRIGRRDVHAMPPLGSNVVDTEGVNLLSTWINSLTVCSPPVPPVINDPGAQISRQDTSVLLTVTATDANNDTLTFSATGLPPGLGIAPDGTISGTPTTAGTWSVTVTVDDGVSGADSATFNWTITDPLCAGCIDFAIVTTSSFTGDYDSNVTILNGGASIRLDNNTWRQTDTTYTITLNTVIEFKFESSVQGEIHGMGFDEDSTASADRIFRVYGTQNWGIADFNTYSGSGQQTFTIPVGQYYTGSGFRLILVNDDDAAVGANGTFSDVRIYE